MLYRDTSACWLWYVKRCIELYLQFIYKDSDREKRVIWRLLFHFRCSVCEGYAEGIAGTVLVDSLWCPPQTPLLNCCDGLLLGAGMRSLRGPDSTIFISLVEKIYNHGSAMFAFLGEW